MVIKELFELKGHKALVTGSRTGIGKAIALGLAEYGADVYIHCSKWCDELEEVAEEARAFGVKAYAGAADLSLDDGPQKLCEQVRTHFEGVDILVLNASIQIRKSWNNIAREEFNKQVTVNFRASLELIQLFAPEMIKKGWGRIVTIGSVQQFKPHPDMVVYAATKDAQLSMVKNLSKQFASSGVTVNNMAPGAIKTNRDAHILSDPAYMEKVLEKIPCGYMGNVNDCVGMALLLCSDAGRYITGADLLVDGGMHL